MAGRPEEPGQRTCAHNRAVVRGSRAQTRAGLDELPLLDVGKDLPGGLEQPVHGTGGDRQVESTLFDGRPDDDLAARPGDHVTARRSHDAGRRRPLRRAAQPQDLALHGPDGRRIGHAELRAARARRHDDRVGRDRAIAGANARHGCAGLLDGLDRHA